MGKHKKPEPIETTELCRYGCGKVAKYVTVGGHLICESSPNKCPVNRSKNSVGGKLAVLGGKKKPHSEIYRDMSKDSKDRMAWNRGLTKETDERIRKQAEITKAKYASGECQPVFLGKHHSDETKKLLSKKRIEFLESNNNHGIKWYEINGVKVQGTWEKTFAEKMNELGVIWERNRLQFAKTRTYTPDFYLVDLDIYVEIKGFMRENDKCKMHKVLEEHDVDIRIIESLSEIDKITKDKIVEMKKFVDVYPKDSIDYSKFNNHW